MHEYVNYMRKNLFFLFVALIPVGIILVVAVFLFSNNNPDTDRDIEYNNSESVIVEEQGSLLNNED